MHHRAHRTLGLDHGEDYLTQFAIAEVRRGLFPLGGSTVRLQHQIPFTMAADLLLTMLMRWSRRMPRPATEWPSLLVHADLARARPSWKALYAAEGLSGW